MKKVSNKPKNAKEFDAYFEDHDISDLLDKKSRFVDVNLSESVFKKLSAKAKTLGLSPQSLIKFWTAEKLGFIH